MNHFWGKHWPVIVIAVIFLLSRFLVFNQIYHQDEYKWAMIVNPVFGLDLKSNHPPLVGITYRLAGELAGFDHLRVVPIVFGLGVLILAYALARKLYGARAALWTTVLLTLNGYNFIASTQIDIDGAMLPFFGLLLMYAYFNLDLHFIKRRDNRRWFVLAAVAMIAGLLTKLSFLLVPLALFTDFLFVRKPNRRIIATIVGTCAALAASAALLVLILVKVFAISHIADFVEYAGKFGILNFASRNYGQVLFLTVKSFVLASPLLLVWYFLVVTSKTQIARFRFWLIFLAYNVLFYYVIFDFTNRTMERYLMFLIVPGAVLGGYFISRGVEILDWRKSWKSMSLLAVLCVGISVALLVRTYDVLPLNPKSAYLAHLKHFDLNFLIPITGGSGPIGFYLPVLYIFVIWIISLIGIVMYRYGKSLPIKNVVLVVILALGFCYTLVVDGEFISGYLYGSANTVARSVMAEAVSSTKVERVTTYYDTGAYELETAGKYERRFYTDPMFAESNRGRFSTFTGYYTVVDFPLIDKNSLYWKYFETCRTSYHIQSGLIEGFIFDCAHGNRNLFK